MLVIPAIDLKDGQCVRLKQGRMDDATTYGDDPVAMAERWVAAGARRLHLVDLNGAFEGKPVNGQAVTDIARAYPDLPIQIGRSKPVLLLPSLAIPTARVGAMASDTCRVLPRSTRSWPVSSYRRWRSDRFPAAAQNSPPAQ